MKGVKGSKPPHGDIGRYSNHGCRCGLCRRANADWHREYMHRTGRKRPLDVYLAEHTAAYPIQHGNETGYRRGCRCDQCREAANAARNRRRRENGPGPNATHGTNSTYSNGCRCDACRTAVASYQRERYISSR